MTESYDLAAREIAKAVASGGDCLDCGANEGYWYSKLSDEVGMPAEHYYGIEWNKECAEMAQRRGISVSQGDLNKNLPFHHNKFACVFGLSVLEHLLHPCNFLKESHRVLAPGGKLVILTPNISTYFTIALLLAGKMPSSGPHPDSNNLLKSEELFKVSPDSQESDAEADTPVHRHLIVFSFKVLRRYLESLGFSEVKGYGFGLYPFPNFAQPLLERIDPLHCHQMVFVATK